jgi:hypothetical protein
MLRTSGENWDMRPHPPKGVGAVLSRFPQAALRDLDLSAGLQLCDRPDPLLPPGLLAVAFSAAFNVYLCVVGRGS